MAQAAPALERKNRQSRQFDRSPNELLIRCRGQRSMVLRSSTHGALGYSSPGATVGIVGETHIFKIIHRFPVS
jgi:hypothetical protein